MQARVTQQGEITIIFLSGRVDVETAQPFREACLNYLKTKKVVFDFKNLSFVGSSGILAFLDTLQDYALGNPEGFNFSGVGSEFRKIFSATALHNVQIFELPTMASAALLNPQPVLVAETQKSAIIESEMHADSEFGFLSLKPEAATSPLAADEDCEA